MSIIKTHRELANLIAGKRILHANSLGKDSVIALEWLCSYAKPSKIFSVYYGFLANHPDDKRYLDYLRKRFPQVEFIVQPNVIEINLVTDGHYQSPLFVNHIANKFEEYDIERSVQTDQLMEKLQCDYICDGSSKYESFARRTKFHQKGLEFQGIIYPLGMMSKDQVIGLIKSTGIKLHPMYKTARSTYDHPTWWKMKAGLLAKPEYWDSVRHTYPLIVLDRYRYEVLLGKSKKA